MCAQESLRLHRRLKTAHASLSYTRRLMRKLGTIVRILRCIVNRIGDQFSMRDTIASQLIGHNLPSAHSDAY